MPAHTLVAFLVASLVLTLLPGPNLMMVLRTALRDRRTGVLCGLGVACGSLAWGLAAAVGVAALLRAWAPAYETVRLAGAAYLALVGARTLWRARRAAASLPTTPDRPIASRVQALAAGLASDLFNPKTGIFYVAIVPQLIPAGASIPTGMLVYAMVDAVVCGLWFTLVSHLAHGAGRWLHRPGLVQRAEQVVGVMLIGLGVRTAFERA